MNDLLRPLFNLLPAMWEKRWWGLAVAWAVAALGTVGVLHYKERYLATATVFVDTQSVLRPLMNGLTVQPDLGEQANMLARTLLSPPNISTLIDQNHLLPKNGPPETRARLIQRLMKAIQLKINGRDNLYEISYIGTNREQTLGLVRSVLDLFVHQGITGNQEDSQQALQFLDSQIAAYDKKLRDAENKLKDFKIAHPGYSGQTTTDYYSRVSQLQDQLTVLQGQLSSAVSSRDTLRQQLAAVNPGLAVPLLPDSTRAASLQPILDIDQRIALQRKQLDDLLQRYTEDYPDVITTRQTIARLEREKRKQAKMPKAAADSADALQSAAATNPVYQQLRITLAQADANVASLQAQVRDLQSRLSQLRAQATQMPKFDEQYNQLNRDYNSVNENYQKLVQRRESAILSRDQDNSRKHSLFRIIDPPRLSPSALFPRRTFLLAFLLVCALGFGTLTTYLLVLLTPTFHNLRELRESTGRPALGAISLTLTPAETGVEHRNQNLFMLASGLLVIGLVTLTVLNILKPIH